jgi:hypothetical protein
VRPAKSTPVAGLTRRGFLVALAALGLAAQGRVAVAASTPAAVGLLTAEEPLTGGRMLASGGRLLPPREVPRFHLLGIHWRGAGQVWARARRAGGPWTPWWPIELELPAGAGGWQIGNPLWTGAADQVQYRLEGAVVGLRAHYVQSSPVPQRRLAHPHVPGMVGRAGWQADESIVARPPAVASRLRLAIVHHTAGQNATSPDESAAIVRAIQLYHVQGNGWDDIGYNFLVDRFGQIFEGRAGGIERNIVGAHAAGVNTGSLGVAVIGGYESVGLSSAARAALVHLLAWRLDAAHVDPATPVAVVVDGAERTLPAIIGHRELGRTACPGGALAAELASVAREVAQTGFPKLYEPRLEGAVPGAVRFQARLSESRSWRIVVIDRRGRHVAVASGQGDEIDWTWDAHGGHGGHAWAITSGPHVRPAAGLVPIAETPGGRADTAEPRPADVPRAIPAWAWRLHAWQRQPASRRGTRPSAPRKPPPWYWAWHHWRMQTVEAQRSELRRQIAGLRRAGLTWRDIKASSVWDLYLALGGR